MKKTKVDYTFILQWAKKIRAANFLGGKCSICGEKNIFYFDFHHKNKKDKEYSINDLNGYRWSKMKEELEKCEILCKNCHAEIHSNSHITKNREYKKKLKFLESKSLCCSRCKYVGKNLASLDFHHIKGEKLYKVNDIIHHRFHISAQQIVEELEKCEILCKNCHAEEQVNKEKFELFKSDIIKMSYLHKERRPTVDVASVKNMVDAGMKQIDIARALKCARSTICEIIKRNFWGCNSTGQKFKLLI